MLTAGDTFGGFEILHELGRGGMGVVYRARQCSLDRLVALKVLAPHLATDVGFRERFRREAITAARLRHPSIVTVFEAGETDGQLFLAMELIDGTTMAHLMGSPALTRHTTVRLLNPIANALDRAHAAGLVHRDIKPQNILVGRDGGVYLADFGVAKSLDTTAATGRGQFLGTVNYASPEQIRGERVTGASDRYSLGVLLFEALTGHLPFERESTPAVMIAHLQEPAPKPSALRGGLPAELDEVLDKALAKNPGDRYSTAAELVQAASDALPAPSADEQETIVVRDVVTSPRLGPWEGFDATTRTRAVPEPTSSFPEDARRRRGRLALFAGVAVTAALVALGAVLLLSGSDNGPSLASLLEPVDARNKELSRTFEALTSRDGEREVRRVAGTALPTLAKAAKAIAAVEGGRAGGARAALTLETGVLDEISHLSRGTSVTRLRRDAQRLDARLTALEPSITIAPLELDRLISWWLDRRRNLQFVSDVDEILAASRPARRELRRLELGIRDKKLDLQQARTIVERVINNREQRVSDSFTLNAPTDRARTIKRRLSLAFQRSLALNNDFRSALLTEPTGDVPTYLLEAFEERYGPSDASTEAKQRFAGAYNSLRARLGLKGKIDENF